MDLHLKGRKVLITGASQGIGEGLARAFAGAGCELFLVARSADNLSRVADDVRRDHSVEVHCLPLDLTASGAIAEIMAFAGGADVDEAAWRQGWELKVFGCINLTRAMYAAMKARGSGVILNNIGIGGQNFDFNYIAGTTGNAALMAFTCALGGRSLDDGLRVVGVNPGPVATDRLAKVMRAHSQRVFGDDGRYPELLSTLPLGRPASVDEVADLFVYLASDRSRYTTGTIVTVDGGLASKRAAA
jgi:NAD(P)-dependent dehydrogenase (short-subunit alcohol dehydrogenase family)